MSESLRAYITNNKLLATRVASIVTKAAIVIAPLVTYLDFLEHSVSVATLALVVWLAYVGIVNRLLPLVGI